MVQCSVKSLIALADGLIFYFFFGGGDTGGVEEKSVVLSAAHQLNKRHPMACVS